MHTLLLRRKSFIPREREQIPESQPEELGVGIRVRTGTSGPTSDLYAIEARRFLRGTIPQKLDGNI